MNTDKAAALADTDAEIGSELQIQTTQDYHELRRYQQIHTARERYLKAELYGSSLTDQMEAYEFQQAAHTAALQYLRELEPIMRRTGSELLQERVGWTAGPAPISPRQKGLHSMERQRLTAKVDLSYEELLARGGDAVPYEVEYTEYSHDLGRYVDEVYHGRTKPPMSALAQIVRHCDQFVEAVLPFRLEEEESPLVL